MDVAVELLDQASRYRVQRLTLAPGAVISARYHRHRSTTWVVVLGALSATLNMMPIMKYENESFHAPMDVAYRLSNTGKIPLVLIEISYGSYIADDDQVLVD